MRCVVIGGADIGDYERVKSFFRDDDCFYFCDSGLRHMDALGVSPSLIVGDFDSHENPRMDVETIVLPREKDDTDTVFAVKEALRRGFDDFLLTGVVGARLDHTLGNVYILVMLDSMGKRARLIDDYSDMEMVSNGSVFIDEDAKYFSLLNITGEPNDVTIENAKFPLVHASIDCGYQYGISNEVLPGRVANVSVHRGRLLLIRVFNDK